MVVRGLGRVDGWVGEVCVGGEGGGVRMLCVGWMSGYIVGNMDDSCMQSHATHHTANPKSKDEYTHYTPILEAPERNP